VDRHEPGLGVAIAVGWFFFHGTLKFPWEIFLSHCTILILVAIQLALTGVHELSEAMWLPSTGWRCMGLAQSCAMKFSFSA